MMTSTWKVEKGKGADKFREGAFRDSLEHFQKALELSRAVLDGGVSGNDRAMVSWVAIVMSVRVNSVMTAGTSVLVIARVNSLWRSDECMVALLTPCAVNPADSLECGCVQAPPE